MSVDEFALRQEAKDLAGLYRELGEAMFSKQKPPEVQTMKAGFGPRTPAPDHIISLDQELTSRLFEMVSEVRDHIRPTLILTHNGMRLCSFLAFNAQAVSELDVAPDLMDEMKDQARQIKRIVAPRGIDHVANRPEPRQRAEVILQRLARMGHTISSTTLRTWASKGHITTELRENRGTYLMTEVLAWVTRDVVESQ